VLLELTSVSIGYSDSKRGRVGVDERAMELFIYDLLRPRRSVSSGPSRRAASISSRGAAGPQPELL